MVEKVWDEFAKSNDPLLFGSPDTAVDLSTLHPGQVQIFRLWQIYLDNVNPLLKITHTPTLQARIIDAAGDVTKISPTLEALMFSIYCVSILSLEDDQCLAAFGSPKEDFLRCYQFGCQQALQNAGVLRTSDRDCLTALHLFLVGRSVCCFLYLLLTLLDLLPKRYRPQVFGFDSWRRHSRRATYGYP